MTLPDVYITVVTLRNLNSHKPCEIPFLESAPISPLKSMLYSSRCTLSNFKTVS